MERKNTSALTMLVGSMLIFGTIGLVRRYIPLSSGLLACLRGLLGGCFLSVIVLMRKRSLRFHFSRKQIILLCITGAALGLNWILLFESYNYTSIAVSTLCYYMEPTIVILLSPIFFREKLTAQKLICVIISLIGITLVSGILNGEQIGTADIKGILFGLGAAVLYSVVVIFNKKNPIEDAYGKTIIQLFAAAAVLIPYLLLTEDFGRFMLDGKAIVMILIAGILHTGIAYALYFGSMDRLPSQTVAVMSYIDPIFAILISAVFLHEPMTLLTGIGAVLVIGAAVFSEINLKNIKDLF